MSELNQSKHATKLAIVVPCFNEGGMLGITIPTILSFVDELIKSNHCASSSYVVLVDDGSSDNTWELIVSAADEAISGRLRGLRLASNVGHQAALLCGLEYVSDRCDAAVSIDADLQDDLDAILKMLVEFRKGFEIVLGVRVSREVDTWFKRNTALAFYKLMKLMGVDIVENHADFRLMSARTLASLRAFHESNLFLRGLPPLLHKSIATVHYQRAERVAGETKYPLSKMLALAWDGITSFSIVPLRLISAAGGLIFVCSLFMATYAVIGMMIGRALPGWTSIVVPLYLIGGLLMLSIGVVGEYVGKVFLEVKGRPRYLLDMVVGEPSRND